MYGEPKPGAGMKASRVNTASLPLARDRKLVKQILAGDEKAMRRFIDEYFPRVCDSEPRYSRYPPKIREGPFFVH